MRWHSLIIDASQTPHVFFWEISFHDLNDFHDLKITWRNQAFHQVMEVTFHTLATQSGDASHGRWDPANHGRRWGARFLKRTSHAFYEGGFPPESSKLLVIVLVTRGGTNGLGHFDLGTTRKGNRVP
jgi:hypothetical protein